MWGRNAHAKLITAFNVIGYTREVSEGSELYRQAEISTPVQFYEEHETIFLDISVVI